VTPPHQFPPVAPSPGPFGAWPPLDGAWPPLEVPSLPTPTAAAPTLAPIAVTMEEIAPPIPMLWATANRLPAATLSILVCHTAAPEPAMGPAAPKPIALTATGSITGVNKSPAITPTLTAKGVRVFLLFIVSQEREQAGVTNSTRKDGEDDDRG